MAQEQVRIFDTTLRDGEQAPGFSLRPSEKIQLARQLETEVVAGRLVPGEAAQRLLAAWRRG